jgi:hypothetical protein
MMFVNDHSPPHVLVFGHGGEAKFVLKARESVVVESSAGISRGDMRRLLQEVAREYLRLLGEWRRIHE